MRGFGAFPPGLKYAFSLTPFFRSGLIYRAKEENSKAYSLLSCGYHGSELDLTRQFIRAWSLPADFPPKPVAHWKLDSLDVQAVVQRPPWQSQGESQGAILMLWLEGASLILSQEIGGPGTKIGWTLLSPHQD